MSSELRRQLRVALGPAITGLQRAVALEIADDARWDDNWDYDAVKGRRSRAKLSELALWTGAKDTNVVRNAIKRLSTAGWEFRIAIGKDKHGNPVYGVPGKAMTFRVPDFDPPSVATTPEGVATATPYGEAGATPEPEGVATATPRESEGYPYGEQGLPLGVAVATPPSLVSPCSSPKESPSSSVAEDSSVVTDTVTVADEGGGGGDSESRSIAEMIAAALDYRGQQPTKKQQQTLTDRLAAALDGGWTVDGLAEYLALKGKVDSAYALYAYRLKADVLPEPAQPDPYGRDRNGFPTAESGSVADLFRDDPADGGMWARAAARADARSQPLVGTDARVQGWLDLSRQLAAEDLSTADQRVL